MAIIDLAAFDRDFLVLHYGGELREIDARTIGQSLLQIEETIQAINDELFPGHSIEVRLTQTSTGSFRAAIRCIRKFGKDLLDEAPNQMVWIALNVAISLAVADALQDNTVINIMEDKVIINTDENQIVIPRLAYPQCESIGQNQRVNRALKRNFEILEKNKMIQSFGISPSFEYDKPLVVVPREHFHALANPPQIIEEPRSERPQVSEAMLIVRKAWLDGSDHKWGFEWNGVPISSQLLDAKFRQDIKRGRVKFGGGDALHVRIRYNQRFNVDFGVWENDQNSFEILEVYDHFSKGSDQANLEF